MGLDGKIPKVTTDVTTAWLSNETTNVTESTPTFDAAGIAPKCAGGLFQVSRQLLTQTSRAAAALLTRELLRAVNHAVATALIAGTGTEQPTGIVGTSGVGSVGGTSID
jgi:HK97 family phage major capsid protein